MDGDNWKWMKTTRRLLWRNDRENSRTWKKEEENSGNSIMKYGLVKWANVTGRGVGIIGPARLEC